MADPGAPESTRGTVQSAPVQVSFGKSVSVLLHNRKYLVFTACMCLYNFATRASNTYLPMVIEAVPRGGNYFNCAKVGDDSISSRYVRPSLGNGLDRP